MESWIKAATINRMVVSDIIRIPLCVGKSKEGRGGGLLQCERVEGGLC